MHADLKLYTRKVEVAKDRIPNWPHEKLTVLAEQPSIFYDLMSEAMLDQVCCPANPHVHTLIPAYETECHASDSHL